jgi:hypothetical protein
MAPWFPLLFLLFGVACSTYLQSAGTVLVPNNANKTVYIKLSGLAGYTGVVMVNSSALAIAAGAGRVPKNSSFVVSSFLSLVAEGRDGSSDWWFAVNPHNSSGDNSTASYLSIEVARALELQPNVPTPLLSLDSSAYMLFQLSAPASLVVIQLLPGFRGSLTLAAALGALPHLTANTTQTCHITSTFAQPPPKCYFAAPSAVVAPNATWYFVLSTTTFLIELSVVAIPLNASVLVDPALPLHLVGPGEVTLSQWQHDPAVAKLAFEASGNVSCLALFAIDAGWDKFARLGAVYPQVVLGSGLATSLNVLVRNKGASYCNATVSIAPQLAQRVSINFKGIVPSNSSTGATLILVHPSQTSVGIVLAAMEPQLKSIFWNFGPAPVASPMTLASSGLNFVDLPGGSPLFITLTSTQGPQVVSISLAEPLVIDVETTNATTQLPVVGKSSPLGQVWRISRAVLAFDPSSILPTMTIHYRGVQSGRWLQFSSSPPQQQQFFVMDRGTSVEWLCYVSSTASTDSLLALLNVAPEALSFGFGMKVWRPKQRLALLSVSFQGAAVLRARFPAQWIVYIGNGTAPLVERRVQSLESVFAPVGDAAAISTWFIVVDTTATAPPDGSMELDVTPGLVLLSGVLLPNVLGAGNYSLLQLEATSYKSAPALDYLVQIASGSCSAMKLYVGTADLPWHVAGGAAATQEAVPLSGTSVGVSGNATWWLIGKLLLFLSSSYTSQFLTRSWRIDRSCLSCSRPDDCSVRRRFMRAVIALQRRWQLPNRPHA